MKTKFLPYIFLFLSITALMSCTKDRDDEQSILGAWVETAPVEGRTEIYFSPGDRLTIIDSDGTSEEFIYKIKDGSIYLELAGDVEGYSEIYFEMINENKFKIGNLYGSIPEAEPIFLIFERQ
jgi:hypothetical protein